MRFLALLLLFFATTLPVTISPSLAYQESTRVYSCPMHPEVQSSQEGKCPKCGMNLVAQDKPNAEVQNASAYTCPMHPEIRVDKTGKCPKCGMALIPANPGIPQDFDLVVEATPAIVKARQPVRLRFVVVNPKTAAPARQFALMHEQLFHLFVVSQDLSEFQHIHPEYHSDGSFTIETTLPRDGAYKLYADLYPVDGNPQVLQKNLITAGYRADLFATSARINPDGISRKTVDGMQIELRVDPPNPIAGKPVTLKYHLTDAKTGAAVNDLKPYLGAWGHTLILSEDQIDFVHSHPSELVPEGDNSARRGGGPEVTFESLLPRPGTYRIWTQFQRGDRLSTVSFDIKANVLR